MADLLSKLCQAYGIGLAYHDVWGKPHRVPESTQRALLAAMGVDAAGDAEMERALSTFDQAERRRTIAPAIVARHGEAIVLRLNLCDSPDANDISWRMVEETGATREGTLTPAPAEPERETSFARAFALPVAPPLGYHRLTIFRGGSLAGESLLIVVPPACYRPDALEDGRRVWGPSIQLYGLRSERNWGIGDFTDLANLAQQWVDRGASLIAVNPLHALFPHDPGRASPYSPSSRLFYNVLYLDVEAIEEFAESSEARALVGSAEFQAALARARNAELVDYEGVAELKRGALALVYARFRSAHLAAGDARGTAFRDFCASQGEALMRHALFEALQEHFFRDDKSIYGWQAWPAAFRDPGSAEVDRFAATHRERVEYYQYLQWQAALQLRGFAQRLRDRGAAIGFYADLAVSIDRSGAEAWANQHTYAVAASVGAPPDEFNQRGQDWGLPPLVPQRLRDARYAPFIATLRANMRCAGALRIDHVMGLMRLFWIPVGAQPAHGAYVQYPLDELRGILALESQRHRCLVVGEDLGTVPEELRGALSQAGVVSTRLLIFEHQPSGEFKAPEAYPAQAIVAVSTHDLPTLAGWWEGRDLDWRTELGLFPDEAMRTQQIAAREKDRRLLLQALEREALLPPGAGGDPASLPAMTDSLALAVHAFIARTPAQLMLVQPEDVIGVREQANLPATVDSHPNWRRKLPLTVESWPAADQFVEFARMLQRSRGAS